MRLRRTCTALVAAASLTTVTVFADQHGHPPTPHASGPKSTPAPTPASAQRPAVTTRAQAGTPTAKTPSATFTHGKAGAAKSTARAKSTSKRGSTHASAAATTTTGTSGSTPATTRTTTSNPIAQKIAAHPQLASKLRKMLPSGISLAAASNGFKNQGQFIAAVHVSKNLDIPFRQLKMEMTGANASSLGEAIQKLRPGRHADDAGSEVARAEQQAADDVAATTTTRTASAPKKTSTAKSKAHKG